MSAPNVPFVSLRSLTATGLLAPLALAGALSCRAAGTHEPPAEQAGPASAASATPRKPVSMDDLRERLAEKLGAAKAPGSPTPYVVRVENKTEGKTEGEDRKSTRLNSSH